MATSVIEMGLLDYACKIERTVVAELLEFLEPVKRVQPEAFVPQVGLALLLAASGSQLLPSGMFSAPQEVDSPKPAPMSSASGPLSSAASSSTLIDFVRTIKYIIAVEIRTAFVLSRGLLHRGHVSAPGRGGSAVTTASEPERLGRAWFECGTCGRFRVLFARRCRGCGFGCCSSCLNSCTGHCFVCELQAEAGTGWRADKALPAPASSFMILGGSIVGSYLALALAKAGFEVHVYDQNEGSGTWRGIINMNAQAVRLLECASPELLEAVMSEHTRADTATFWDATLTRQILSYDIAKEGQRYDLPPYMITAERRTFLEQLRAAAKRAGATYHLGKRAAVVEEEHEGPFGAEAGVRVTFEDGATARADFCIGADGVRSTTRRALFGAHGGERSPSGTLHYACGGIARDVDLPPNAGSDQTEMWGASGCFLIFKYHSGVTFWAALQPGPKPPHPPEVDRQQYQRSLLALVTERFASYHPVARQLVEASELDSVGAFELSEVRMTKWALGRVLLVGDAAHAMCNRLGSGGCTGIEDAWCAAELIELCRRASGGSDEVPAIERAFRLTERRRTHRARRIQFESMLLARLTVVYAGVPGLRTCRDEALRWLGRRTERWRVPLFDFLNNYRAAADHRLH